MIKNILKKILKIILILVLFSVIAIIIDLLVFNFKNLFLANDEKEKIKVFDYTEEVIDGKKTISLDFSGRYVDKLKIKYDCNEDVKATIYYVENNYYGEDKESQFDDTFNDEVNEQITNYRNNIQTLKIEFDEEKDISIDEIIIDNCIKINYFRVFYLVSMMSLLYIIYKAYKKGIKLDKIHRCFFVVGMIVGSTLIFLQPASTFYSWDDQIHFSNVYELIGGNLKWKNGEFSMIEFTRFGRNSVNSIEEQENQKEYLNIDGGIIHKSYENRFITYNEIAYIPSAIGFHFSNFLNLPFDICFKVGQLTNLLFYLLLMSLAIKIAKNGKRLLCVIGLIPTSIFLACQYSYDPAVISGITLGLVCLFNWLLDKDSKVDFKSMGIFIFSMLYGCFPKAVYAPLLMLFLFISEHKFKNKKQSLLLKSGVVIICLLLLSTFVLPAVTSNAVSDTRGGDTSVTGQLSLIISNPFGYMNVLKDTMINSFSSNFFAKGALFNYSYNGLSSDNLYFCFLIFLLFVMFTDNEKFSFKIRDRIILFIALIAVILLIWTALYLSFTPVSSTVINGVQPRYFIPLLFPLLCILKNNKFKNGISENFYNTLIISVPTLVIMISFYQLFILNYCM